MNVSDVVKVDKEILGGTPVFRGTRVPIKKLFDYLKAVDSLNDFLNTGDLNRIHQYGRVRCKMLFRHHIRDTSSSGDLHHLRRRYSSFRQSLSARANRGQSI